MAIDIKKLSDNSVEITQIASKPTVYLDTWALDCFSANCNIGNRFVSSLNRKSGTLALSVISFCEVVNRTDTNQISKILNLIDSVDIVVIDMNSSSVIDREKKGSDGTWLNSEILIPCLSDLLEQFKASKIFLRLKRDVDNGHSIPHDFEEKIFPIVQKARNDVSVLAKAKKRFKDKAEVTKFAFPYTEYLYKKCIDFITINEEMKMSNNEWQDLWHLIVSTAYCNFVLIDKRWTHFIKTTGLKPPQIAMIYNQNNIETFLDNLNKF